jgi:O-antigen/teichoic acid export membrane protein
MLLPLLTRELAPAEYGQVVSFYMLVALCSSVAGLSLQAAVGVRWLDRSRGDPRTYTATALVLILITTAIAALLSATITPAIGIDLRRDFAALAAVVAGTNVLQGVRFAVWQSCERPRPAATLQVSSAVLNITLSLAAVFLLHWGGLGRIGAAVLSGVLVSVVSAWLLFRDQEATASTRRDGKELLRFGVPLIPHTLAGSLLTSADRFAVSAQLGVSALGVYGSASQLGMVMNVIADAAIKAYSPTMYRMLGRNSTWSRLRVVAVTYLSVFVWIAVAFVMWAAFAAMSNVLLGDRYQKAVGLAIWFLLGGAATAIYLNIAGLFFFNGKTEWISASTVTAAVVGFLFANFAVSRFGQMGGAISYLATQCTALMLAWLLSCRVSPMPWSRPLLAVRVLLRPQAGASA